MAITESKNNIQKDTGIYFDRIKKVVVHALSYAGEKGLKEARLHGNYTDRTGNLRSSIGYGVYKEGVKVLGSAFDRVTVSPSLNSRKSSNGSKKPEYNGSTKGKELLAQKNEDSCSDFASLIMVAGMDYAEYVADRGFDVLDGAEHVSKKTFLDLMWKFKQNV